MKKLRQSLMAAVLILCCTLAVWGQDSASSRKLRIDSANNSGKAGTDTGRQKRGAEMASLFADSAKLTSNDYQLQIERTYLLLNNVENKSDLGRTFRHLNEHLASNDSILSVLKENLTENNQALNLRNLQVFKTLLQNMKVEITDQRSILDSAENQLNGLRSSLKKLTEDTIFKQLLKDTVLRKQFSVQLKTMRETWRASIRQLRQNLAQVNLLQTQTSSHSIAATQLLEKVNILLEGSANRIFGKEFNYLWERDTIHLSQSTISSFEKAYNAEKKAMEYYFRESGSRRFILLLVGALFFIWIYRNILSLKRLNREEPLRTLGFQYLSSNFIVSTFVVTFCIAPLFDLHAPSAYIESIEFFLLLILTVLCWRKWPRKLFLYWTSMFILYILFSLSHHMADPGTWQRFGFILLNVLSVVFGILFLRKLKDHLPLKGFLRFVIILHNALNIIAVFCNLFGRLSLAQMLGNAAIFSFMQAIGLAVFSAICMEAILLQMVASRARRGVQSNFEYQHVLKSFSKPILFLVVLLWVIVFATNMNIYIALFNGVLGILETPRHLGNAHFTIGGILLFFLIIWIAHLLQKYVGYFFGDTGSEDDHAQDKRGRSRLLIARLILLCIGYLLAVVASGIPVDKITIVLGALGVGIGLGLQNIVNNFVSGIILIFDRPLQIGDLVEVGDKSGKVREIGLRSSTLLTRDGAEVIIPNGDILSQQIVNWTLSNNQQRLEMELSVTGSRDMETVSSVIKKAVLSSGFVHESREPQILFTAVQEDGFSLKVYFWCTDVLKSEQAKSDILLLLHEQLNKENLFLQ